MQLLTEPLRRQLLKNGRVQDDVRGTPEERDFEPVVKLFTPDSGANWLLTELDPDEPDIAFGLCDLGMGCPELGSVRISELETVRGPLGMSIERDLHFVPDKPLSAYAREASQAGRIVA